jgi:hypothetical protein
MASVEQHGLVEQDRRAGLVGDAVAAPDGLAFDLSEPACRTASELISDRPGRSNFAGLSAPFSRREPRR